MIRTFTLLLAAALLPAAFAGVDTGLASLLPGGTQMVFNINVQESRNSQFGRFLLKDVRWTDTKMQEVMAATGFDPRRDLVTLLVAAPDSAPPSRQNGNFLVLARGSFDAAKIGAAALQHGWTKQNLSGVNFYSETGDHGQAHGFAFLDVDVAAMGDLASIKQVIGNARRFFASQS